MLILIIQPTKGDPEILVGETPVEAMAKLRRLVHTRWEASLGDEENTWDDVEYYLEKTGTKVFEHEVSTSKGDDHEGDEHAHQHGTVDKGSIRYRRGSIGNSILAANGGTGLDVGEV